MHLNYPRSQPRLTTNEKIRIYRLIDFARLNAIAIRYCRYCDRLVSTRIAIAD
ncbi:MAG: hypothetical protein V7K75_26330 [Nostoc sp.]